MFITKQNYSSTLLKQMHIEVYFFKLDIYIYKEKCIFTVLNKT